MDPETCPAIVCCGGRMDFHGAPMSRTWVKLGRTARAGDAAVTLAEPVTGWRVGDRVIVTATQRQRRERGTLRTGPGHGLDARPSPRSGRSRRSTGRHAHARPARSSSTTSGEGDYRGEVANLSRNVVVESADPGRGPRPYDVPPRLGRLDRATPSSATWARKGSRGSTASTSTWSATRCAAARSSGRRSGTAATAGSRSTGRTTWSSATASATSRSATGSSSRTAPRSTTSSTATWPCRRSPASRSRSRSCRSTTTAGAGFWWANSRNTFTRNVAVECDRYGYRFEATPLHHDRARSQRPRARGHARGPSTSASRSASPDGTRTAGRHPHAAVRPVRGQRGAQPALRDQPGRGRARGRPRRAAPVHSATHGSGTISGRSGPTRPRSSSTAWPSTTGGTGSTGRSSDHAYRRLTIRGVDIP